METVEPKKKKIESVPVIVEKKIRTPNKIEPVDFAEIFQKSYESACKKPTFYMYVKNYLFFLLLFGIF